MNAHLPLAAATTDAHEVVTRHMLLERVRRNFRKGMREFRLVQPSDRILVGLSGGKDSMALLQLLGEWNRHARNKFPLTALHVRMKGVDYQSDASYLERFAESCGADFLLKTGDMPIDRNEKRTPCFLCAWNRRKILFETAQELGYNKIALGHHRDDILTTTLMNLLYNGSFSTMPVVQGFRKMPLIIIRPLCRVEEADLRQWAILQGYEPLVKTCPNDQVTHRIQMHNLLESLQSMHPEAKSSLWHALHKSEKLVDL